MAASAKGTDAPFQSLDTDSAATAYMDSPLTDVAVAGVAGAIVVLAAVVVADVAQGVGGALDGGAVGLALDGDQEGARV